VCVYVIFFINPGFNMCFVGEAPKYWCQAGIVFVHVTPLASQVVLFIQRYMIFSVLMLASSLKTENLTTYRQCT